MDSETVWADPENRTEAQHVDALLKMRALGVPLAALWEMFGATPVQIERWTVMKAKEDAAARANPQATPGLVESEAKKISDLGELPGGGAGAATPPALPAGSDSANGDGGPPMSPEMAAMMASMGGGTTPPMR